MISDEYRRIIEAAIFAASEPISAQQLKKIFAEDAEIDIAKIKAILQDIAIDWREKGIELKEVASGFRFQVKKEYAPYIKQLWQERPPRYSRAFLETLALIAYRQPITRAEIEDIRGVATTSNIIKSMLERNWVRIVGHRDIPGRPELLATTREFLDYFNLKSLDELPPLSELQNIDQVSETIAQLLGQNSGKASQSVEQAAIEASANQLTNDEVSIKEGE